MTTTRNTPKVKAPRVGATVKVGRKTYTVSGSQGHGENMIIRTREGVAFKIGEIAK